MAKRPIEQSARPEVSLESESRGVSAFHQDTATIAAALELTRTLLASSQSEVEESKGNKARREAIFAKATEQLGIWSAERTKEKIEAQQGRQVDFIRGGKGELRYLFEETEQNTEIGEEQKKERQKELRVEYINARLQEKMVLVDVAQSLLKKLHTPFITLQEAAQFTKSVKRQNGRWYSEFNPSDIVGSEASQYISQPKLEEMRAAIQHFLHMKEQVELALEKYKLPGGQVDGRELVRKEFRFEPKGRVRVKKGPLSVSIYIDNEEDFKRMYRDESELPGGFHKVFTDIGNREFGDQHDYAGVYKVGIYNVINGFNSRETVFDHENEHSLNEILLRHRGRKTTHFEVARDDISSLQDTFERESYTQRVFDDLLYEANNRLVQGFSDEALAYLLTEPLGDQPPKKIAERYFERIFQGELYSRYKPTKEVVSRFQSDILKKVEGGKKFEENISDTEKESQYKKFLEHLQTLASKITEGNINEKYKSMLEAVARMKQEGYEINFIRAVFAGENPLRWSSIVQRIIEIKKMRISPGVQRVQHAEAKITDRQESAIRALLIEQFSLEGEINKHSLFVDADVSRLLPDFYVSQGEAAFRMDPLDENVTLRNMRMFAGDNLHGLAPILRYEDDTQDICYYINPNNGHKAEVKRSGTYYLSPYGVSGRVLYGGTKGIYNDEGKDMFPSLEDMEYKPDSLVEIGGKLRIKVNIKGGKERKYLIAKEEGGLIGVEYRCIGEIISFQGKLIFTAQLENGKWILTDEEGNVLSKKAYEKISLHGNNTDQFLYIATLKDKGYLFNATGESLGDPQGYMPGELTCERNGLLLHAYFYNEDGERECYLPNGNNFTVAPGEKVEEFQGQLIMSRKTEGKRQWVTATGEALTGEHPVQPNLVSLGKGYYYTAKTEQGKRTFNQEKKMIDEAVHQQFAGKKYSIEKVLQTTKGSYYFFVNVEGDTRYLVDGVGQIVDRDIVGTDIKFSYQGKNDDGEPIVCKFRKNQETGNELHAFFDVSGKQVTDWYVAEDASDDIFYDAVGTLFIVEKKEDGVLYRENLKLGDK